MFKNIRVRAFERLSRLSRWFEWRFTPAGKLILILLLVSGVIGVDTSRNLSYQIFAFSAAVILLSMFFSTFNRDKYICSRTLPPMATVGVPVRYSISVTNKAAFRKSELLIADQLQQQSPTEQELRQFRDPLSLQENRYDRIVGFPRWVRLSRLKRGASIPGKTISSVPAYETVKVEHTFTPLRRGYIHFQEIAVGCPDVSSIFRSIYRQTLKNSLLVLPKRYPVPDLNLSGHRHHHQGGVALSSHVGETAEFHGLRDYRPGDPLRHIHWRSWARTDKPVVKKYEDEFFVRHAMILDTYARGATTTQFEEAVSVAASLALNVSDQESLLDLMFVDRHAYRFTTGRHTADVQYLLEVLACVSPEYHQSFNTLSRLVNYHAGQLSSAILVLLRWDEPRQALVKMLKAIGVNIIALIVCETDELPEKPAELGPMTDRPQLIHWLQAGNIEQGLAHLSQVRCGFS